MKAWLIIGAVSLLGFAWVVIVTHASSAAIQWYQGRGR